MMIIITGGGSGIGRSLTQSLAKRGCHILIIGRREQNLKETQSHSPSKIDYIVADISNEKGRLTVLQQIQDDVVIQGLVHNAGTIEPLKPLKEINLSEWRHAQAINVEAPLFLTQALLPKLKEKRVLHVSSGVAHFPIAAWGAYCTSKAALFMLYQLFKREIPDVLFASVKPGITDTAMQATIRAVNKMSPDDHGFFSEMKENDKLLSPTVVAQFLTWLLLDVDGNQYIQEEWDIYDESHHKKWLTEGTVPKVFDDE